MPKTDLNGITDLNSLTAEDINSIAEYQGRQFADRTSGIKTNQVRNIYSAVLSLREKLKTQKQFSEEIKTDLILLKPKLAYAAGRQQVVRPFYDLISKAINCTVDSKEQLDSLKKFISLMEAIVAYHKFHGGKDK